jgi:hypothetical protein
VLYRRSCLRERFTAAGGAAAIIAGLGIVITGAIAAIATAPAAEARDIFQIEFRQCVVIHVGYRDFPAGAVVSYVVRQNGAVNSRGRFTTQGGENKYHFINLRLARPLTPGKKASATFNGTFTVSRAPGCIKPPSTSVVPITSAGSTVPNAGASTTVAPVAAVAGGTTQGPLAFTGSSNVPATLLGLLILACGGALLALGLRGPLSRRKMPERVLPPWLHVPVPSGAFRRRGGAGRSPKSAKKNKLPPWLHTGVPTRKRKFF